MEEGVPFDKNLLLQIREQSQEICKFTDCINVTKKLLEKLGYEVLLKENSHLVITRSTTVRDISVTGIPAEIHDVEETAKILLLGKSFSKSALENLKQLILLRLKSTGYREARVDEEIKKTKSGVLIRIIVTPGVLYYIKQVDIVCPEPFREKVSLEFNKFRLKAVNLNEIRDTAEKIEKLLIENGFFNCSVRFSFTPLEKKDFFLTKKKPVKLFVKVKTGKHYIVKFQGNRHLTSEQLLKVLTFQTAKSVDEFELENSRKNIENLYKNQGFPYVKVKVSLLESENSTTILFKIHEGKKVVIEEIASPVNIPESKKLLGKPFSQTEINRVIQKIRSTFLAKGFKDAKVKFQIEGNKLSFTVNTGKQYLITSIESINDKLLCTKKIKLKLPIPYTSEAVEQIKTDIESCYSKRGFVFSSVKVSPTVKDANNKKSVHLTIRIVPGERYRTGYVIISGLKRTKPKWIKNLIILKPGDIYSKPRVIKQYSLLTESRLFSSISIEEIVTNTTISEVIFSSEGNKLSVRGFAGYGSDSGYVLNGFASSTSPFGFGLKYFLFGNYRQKEGYDAVFKLNKPAFPFRSYETSYSIVKKEQIYESFKTDRTLYRFSLSRKISRTLSQTFGMEISREKVKDTTIETETRFVKRNIFYAQRYDKRDSLTNPREGYLTQLYVSLAGQILGGNTDFLLTDLKLLYLIPVGKNDTLAIRTGLGLIQPLKGSSVPIQDRFFLGGAESVRGYKFGTISPQDSNGNFIGGEAYGLFSIELRHNIRKDLQIALFYDSGNVFPQISNFKLNIQDWYSSVGFGIRYITPVGPLRLDYGFKLKKIKDQGPGRIHISFGFPF